MTDKNGRGARSDRPSLLVVRRDGTLRRAGAKMTKDPQRDVAFPIVVEFARGATTPRIESLVAMHACAHWLARRRDELVTVVGHANLRSSETAAKALARERVAAVSDLLVLLGAKRSQLVPLKSVRLHSVPSRSTLGARRGRRVVVIFRHAPPRLALGKAARRVAGAPGRNSY